jgi:hypothetical protein
MPVRLGKYVSFVPICAWILGVKSPNNQYRTTRYVQLTLDHGYIGELNLDPEGCGRQAREFHNPLHLSHTRTPTTMKVTPASI